MEASVSNVANYRSRPSLTALRSDLDRSLNLQQKKVVIFELINRGLMSIPWWMKIIKILLGKKKWPQYLSTLWDHDPKILHSLWDENMKHLVEGKDLVDPTSAGGYNLDEMKQFTEILNVVRYVPGNVLVITAINDGWFIDDQAATACGLREEFSIG